MLKNRFFYLVCICFFWLASLNGCQSKKHIVKTDQQTEQQTSTQTQESSSAHTQTQIDSFGAIQDTTKHHTNKIIKRDFTQVKTQTTPEGGTIETKTDYTETVLQIDDREFYIQKDATKNTTLTTETATDKNAITEASEVSSTQTSDKTVKRKFAKFLFPTLFLLLLLLLLILGVRAAKKYVKRF